MEELFMKLCFDLQYTNLSNLDIISQRINIRSKNWEKIKQAFIKEGLYSEEDFKWIEDINSGADFYIKGGTVPSFIVDRSMVVSNNYFVNRKGSIYTPSYEHCKNNTYTINNGIIAYKDKQGVVRLTPYSTEIVEFLTYGCHFRETHDIYVPMSNGDEKFANSELQRKWESFNEVINMSKNYDVDYRKYFESKGKEMFLLDIAFGVDSTIRTIKEKIEVDYYSEEQIRKICDLIEQRGDSLKRQIEILRKTRDYNLKNEVKKVNPNVLIYKNWLSDISSMLKNNQEIFAKIVNVATYLSIDEIATEVKMFFEASEYVASIKNAVDCALKEGIDITMDIKSINKTLSMFGISLLDLLPNQGDEVTFERRIKRQNKDILESVMIDKFLDKSIENYYEDDIVTTNINRLIELNKKIQTIDNKEAANQMIQYLLNRLIYYLNTHYDDYKKQLEVSGINVDEHMANINKKLCTIGLTVEDFQNNSNKIIYEKYSKYPKIETKPKDVSKKLKMNNDISDFLKKYFNIEIAYDGDYITNLIIAKIIIENYWIDEIRQNKDKMLNSYGESFDDFERTIVKIIRAIDDELVTSINNKWKDNRIKNGENWEEYEKKLNILLAKIGIQVNDFLAEGFVKSDETFNMKSLNVSKDVFIEMCKEKERKIIKKRLEYPLRQQLANERLYPYEENYINLLQLIEQKDKSIITGSRNK